MRVLFCGDREWTNRRKIRQVLAHIQRIVPDAIIVHGACRGADRIAGQLATELFGVDKVEAHPADWNQYGLAAGPIRNQAMIRISADRAYKDGHHLRLAFAFHEHVESSTGTKDMVKRLRKARIHVQIIS